MAYLIDGHNLIPNIKGLNLAQLDDEQALVGMLQHYSRAYRSPIEVFFDGAPPGYDRVEKLGRLTVHYIRLGHTADQAIISRLRSFKRSARNWVVVSSDHQVQSEARSLGADVLSGAKFASILVSTGKPTGEANPSEKPGELSSDDIKEWMRLFGQGKD